MYPVFYYHREPFMTFRSLQEEVAMIRVRRDKGDGDEPRLTFDGLAPKDEPQGFDEKAWRREYMRLFMRKKRARLRAEKEIKR